MMGDLGVSKNNGTPKSSILIGFSIINHPFWGTPIFGNTHLFQGGYILVVFNIGNLKNMMLVYTNMLPFLGGFGKFSRGDVFNFLEVVYLHYFTCFYIRLFSLVGA